MKRFAKCVVKGIFFRNEQTWRLPYLFLSWASRSRRIQAGTNKRKHKNELHHLFTSELTLWNKYTEWGASELLRTRGTLLFIQGQAKTRTCFNSKWRNILGVLHILFIHMTCHHDLNFIRVSEKKIQNYFNALRKTEVNVESLFFFFKIRFNNSIYWIVWSLFIVL